MLLMFQVENDEEALSLMIILKSYSCQHGTKEPLNNVFEEVSAKL